MMKIYSIVWTLFINLHDGIILSWDRLVSILSPYTFHLLILAMVFAVVMLFLGVRP